MLRGKITGATIAMTLAINFKQMALYFSLPFALYALAMISSRKSIVGTITTILSLLTVFAVTNLLLWSPWFLQGTEGA